MSFRKTRKYKEKPVIFAFGHIMLPLVAILALGLLVLGVRLLFVSPGSQVLYPETTEYEVPESVAVTEPSRITETSQIVAVPVRNGEGDTGTAEPVAVPPAPGPTDDQPSTQPVTAQKTPIAAPSGQAAKGSWIVQIGAFTLRDSAEGLARDAREKSYEAFVVQAEVGGKTYYRVRIPAGAQKADADNLARELASKGYPTLVTRQD